MPLYFEELETILNQWKMNSITNSYNKNSQHDLKERMISKIIHKKSSVVARVPSAGDLDYGELALNYADGKLYYKNSSNAVKAFIDSAQNVSLITNTIINTVDSDYVLARAGDAGIDSAAVIDLIDSDYVQARQASSGLVGTANTVILNEYTSDGV